MPSPSIGRFTERVQFFDGQRLFASDLQDLEQFNREMRQLHNQSLHQPGVASGYAVSGNREDREVTIQPGYAIDSMGREIVLTEALVLQVPPVASDAAGRPIYYDLVVSYPEDGVLTENRAGVCVSRGAVRLREAPVFCWVELTPSDDPPGAGALGADRSAKLAGPKSQLERGLMLRLARAEVLNCKLNQPLSIAQRRNARPVQQPFTFAGNTADRESQWVLLTEQSPESISLKLSVDTSDARFRSKPRYVAHVIGERRVTWKNASNDTFTRVLDGFGRPEAIDAASFEFHLVIPRMFFNDNENLADIGSQLIDSRSLSKWYVEWLGVEG
ncbi:MAG TPA: hypothetical protein VMG12_26640 [Polyangiaceae bacterium]|nr:hypothetical protein [Polyangiaceae bacterium]